MRICVTTLLYLLSAARASSRLISFRSSWPFPRLRLCPQRYDAAHAVPAAAGPVVDGQSLYISRSLAFSIFQVEVRGISLTKT